jgi:uncharacterized radical SAM superfamily Fe-S cluster-containing enzyme
MTHSQLLDHSFLGVTQSICPECVRVVPAKIIARDGRVYFRKQCPEHGLRDDFVCSDERWFDRSGHSAPGRLPPTMGVAPERGCPYDCGLCTEHEQHTCVAVLEITSSCNLTCPLCYAASAPGGKHVPLDDCLRAIDRLVHCEGRPEILQLSGGEPTVHPQFLEIFEYACSRPIDVVMINTNGIRLARDAAFRQAVARLKHRSEIYLQFDGFRDDANLALRGERLLDVKLRAIEALGEEGIRATLVCTLERELNLDQVGRIVEFGLERPWITGVCFQPATYVGRYPRPEQLERRVTFPDVVRAISEQSSVWRESDFLPLPCAHPNSHTLAYAYRHEGRAVPLTRFLDVENNLDLLANGITFNRAAAQKLIGEFLSRSACGGDESCGCGAVLPTAGIATATSGTVLPMLPADSFVKDAGESFFRRAMVQDLSPADVFRITITSFMDAFNFDIRALMKSCVHHLLPSGHLVPFCAYNLLYRDGRVPLPPLVSNGYAVDGVATPSVKPREVVEIS